MKRLTSANPGNSARVLLLTDGHSLAHVTRVLEVALELRVRGADPHIGADGQFISIVRAHDIPLHPARPLAPDHVRAVDRRSAASYYTDVSLFGGVRDDLRLIDILKPDAVVSDFRASVCISALVSEVPHATILNATWTHFAKFASPMPASHPLVGWPTSAIGLLIPRARPLARSTIRTLLNPLVPAATTYELRTANRPFRLAQRLYNLPLSKDLFETWAGADRVFIADAPVFSPLVDNAPDRFRVVGPVIWRSGPFTSVVLPRRRFIYATAGSTGCERIVDVAKSAAAQLELDVVASGHDGMEGCGSFVDGSHLMRECVAFVCHAGSGTVYQAARVGRRGVFVPTLHDQEWNAELAGRLGLGPMVFPSDLTVARLAEELRVLVGTDSTNAVCNLLVEQARDLDGASAIAQGVLEMLS